MELVKKFIILYQKERAIILDKIEPDFKTNNFFKVDITNNSELEKLSINLDQKIINLM